MVAGVKVKKQADVFPVTAKEVRRHKDFGRRTEVTMPGLKVTILSLNAALLIAASTAGGAAAVSDCSTAPPNPCATASYCASFCTGKAPTFPGCLQNKDCSCLNLPDANSHPLAADALQGVSFKCATLSGAVFSGSSGSPANLKDTDFTCASLGPSANGPADFSNTTLDATRFVGADLRGADFSGLATTLECTDFSWAQLLGADFGPEQIVQAGDGCRTRFNHAAMALSVEPFPDTWLPTIGFEHWDQVDFSHTDFHGASPELLSMKCQDISHACLAGLDFSGFDMIGANLTGGDLTGVRLLHATLDGAILVAADLTGAVADYATFRRIAKTTCSGADAPRGVRGAVLGTAVEGCTDTSKGAPGCKDSSWIYADFGGPSQPATLTGIQATHADFTCANLQNVALLHSELDSATLQGANLAAAHLGTASGKQTSVTYADATAANLHGADLTNVLFDHSILSNANFDANAMDSTSFIGALMPCASFEGATLQDVVFKEAILQLANFQALKVNQGNDINFTCTQLGGADFTNAKLEQYADFTSAVMPASKYCCKPKHSDQLECGWVELIDGPYGPVTFPILADAVVCPSGKTRKCSGDDWSLAPTWKADCGGKTKTTVWSPWNCKAQPSKVVHFKDPALAKCVHTQLGVPSADPITVGRARTASSLSCPGQGIRDLTGLEYFTALRTLGLAANSLSQFTLKLGALEKLTLDGNRLAALDLSGTPKLTFLSAARNALASVASLPPGLEVLDVSGNQLTSVDLTIERELLWADLSRNKLTQVLDDFNHDLSKLTGLHYLDLSGNALTTIGTVAAIKDSLGYLDLECNPSFKCGTLKLAGGADPAPALESSGCADLNKTSGDWTVRVNPRCPQAHSP